MTEFSVNFISKGWHREDERASFSQTRLSAAFGGGRGSAALARAVLGQVAAGLAVLHDRCIIHCDVKTDNVLMRAVSGTPEDVQQSDGFDVKLSDYSRARTCSTQDLGPAVSGKVVPACANSFGVARCAVLRVYSFI